MKTDFLFALPPLKSLPLLRQINDRRYARRYGAEVVAYARQLHPRARANQVSSKIHAAPDGKYLYIAVAKNCTTTIKAALREMEGDRAVNTLPDQTLYYNPAFIHDRKTSPLLDLFTLGTARFRSLLDDPNCVKFSFVRNPYSRLASAWLNKIRFRTDAPNDDAYAAQQRRIAVRQLFGPLASLSRPISFERFIKQVCRQNPFYHDAHWMPQTHALYLPHLRYDLIGRVESLEDDIARLAQKLNKPFPALRRLNVTGKVPPLSDLYTENLRAMVYQKYQCDFETFAYAPLLPKE